MKKKFTLIASLALVGVIGVGFAAWQFGSATTATINVGVDIAGVEVQGGAIAVVSKTASIQLDQTPEGYDIKFTATWTPDSGAEASVLSYTVALHSTLEKYLVVDASSGNWVHNTEKVLRITWAAMDRGTEGDPDVGDANPINYAEYTALKGVVDALPAEAIVITLTAAKA